MCQKTHFRIFKNLFYFFLKYKTTIPPIIEISKTAPNPRQIKELELLRSAELSDVLF